MKRKFMKRKAIKYESGQIFSLSQFARFLNRNFYYYFMQGDDADWG